MPSCPICPTNYRTPTCASCGSLVGDRSSHAHRWIQAAARFDNICEICDALTLVAALFVLRGLDALRREGIDVPAAADACQDARLTLAWQGALPR